VATKSGSRLQAEILPGNWIVHFSHSGLNSSPKDLIGIYTHISVCNHANRPAQSTKQRGGAVEIEEFLMGCLRLRGQARAMDMVSCLHV